MDSELIVQANHPIAHITTLVFNRPQRGNSLSPSMISLLISALDDCNQRRSDPSVAAVVLTGAGKFFCTGMDLGGPVMKAPNEAKEDRSFFDVLVTFPKPIIGRLNGPCIGGGVGIAFCCDIRIAHPDTYIWFSEVKRGLVPALISAICVPQLGLARAKQYMLTAEKVSAQQLLADGQLFAIAPDLDGEVKKVATMLLENAPGAVAMAKEACLYLAHHNDDENRSYVKALYSKMIANPEAAYGMQCFRDKVKPEWYKRSSKL